MIKVLGLFFVLIGAVSLERGFSLSSLGFFLLGLFLVCSKDIFGHLFFVEREKVRAQYRNKK
jgi:hypothetical protein